MTSVIPQFAEMLSEIASAGIVIDPNGTSEPLGNMCSISMTYKQAAMLTSNDVVSFILAVANQFDELRRVQSPDHPMVFYCWTDGSSGQLRFSVVSKLPLPFACSTRITSEATEIAREILTCPWLEGIPFNELRTIQSGDSDRDLNYDRNQYALNVLTVDLPIVSKSHNGG